MATRSACSMTPAPRSAPSPVSLLNGSGRAECRNPANPDHTPDRIGTNSKNFLVYPANPTNPDRKEKAQGKQPLNARRPAWVLVGLAGQSHGERQLPVGSGGWLGCLGWLGT